MRRLSVSICVIRQGDKYLLQKRGDDPKIGAAGKVGAFGGKIEPGETPEQAALREVGEETSLDTNNSLIQRIASYEVIADHQLEDVAVGIEAFELTVDENVMVTANEGEVVSLAESDIKTMLEFMTPATKYYFENSVGV